MPLTTQAKNEALDGIIVDRVQLHSGDPGASGTSNVIASTYVAASFAAAGSSQRVLAAQVDFTGLTPSQSITWFSVWEDDTPDPIFKGRGQITSGDVAANAAGEYSLATGTRIFLSDPS